jgi:hypothetical protein
MKRVSHPPAVSEVPTITDGEPPDRDVQARVVSNQVRAARDWSDTAQDLVINNIVNENQGIRESRREILVLAGLVLVLLILGSIYTYRNYVQDNFAERESIEASNTPYRPETIR